MINNLKFVSSRTFRNATVQILTILSTLSIFLLYFISVLKQNAKLSDGVFDASSGLLDGFHQHMIAYIVSGLTIAYITIFVHKTPQNDGYELNIISRHSDRKTIIISRVLFTVAYIFCYTILQMLLLLAPAFSDDVLVYSDRIKWLFSMVVGIFLVSLIVVSISTFLSLFFSLFISLTLSSALILAFPLISWMQYSLTKPRPIISPESGAALEAVGSIISGNAYDNYIYPNIEDRQLIINNNSINVIKKRYVYSPIIADDLDNKIKGYNNKLHYETLTKIDQWNAFKNYFNVFMPKKLSNTYTYNKYHKIKLSKMHSFNPSDIVNINDVDYVYVMPTIKKSVSYKAIKYTDVTHVQRTTARTRKIIDDITHELENNNSLASTYKNLPFMNQCLFWNRYINMYEESLDGTVHDLLVHKVDQQALVAEYQYQRDHNWVHDQVRDRTFITRYVRFNAKSKDWQYYNYFNEAKRMIDHNQLRYKPASFEHYDPTASVGAPKRTYGIRKLDDEFWVQETKNYETKSVSAYIIPLIACSLLVAALFLYTRRDIK